jgi:hypothetical protein
MPLTYPATLTSTPSFRGERNNNPLNLRLNKPPVPWVGAVPAALQTDTDFIQFITPQHGIRAAALDMRTIALRISHSYSVKLSALIPIWAPAIENNTLAYIKGVCGRCSADPDLPWPVNSRSGMMILIPAFIVQENGRCIYPNSLIEEALRMLPDWQL